MSRLVFHRPARVQPPELPTEPVVLAAPPQPVGKDSGTTWVMLLMPLLSSISMAAYMIVAGRRMLILLGITFVLLSVGVTVGVRMQMRGAQRKTRLRARDRYLQHLVEVRRTARQVAADQRLVSAWAHPSPYRLWAMAKRRHRVWERRPADPDFLRLRVGAGRAPLATPVRLATRNDPTVEYDPRARAAAERLVAATADVGHQPATVDLAEAGVVSVLGPAARASAVARALVTQAAVLHAPDDVAIAVVTGGEDGADWEWAKWLPHTQEPDATGPAGVVPLVAEDFEGIADHLQQHITAAREGYAARRPYGPDRDRADTRRRLLVVLDRYDPRSAWARSAAAQELLESAGRSTATTVVCVVQREADEPTRADVRIRVGADERLEIEARRAPATPPHAVVTDAVADQPEPVLCEAVARALAPLRLSEEGEEILARTVSLPGLLAIDDLAGFDPEDLWVAPDDDAVLRTPIGFDGEGRPLPLDLKEAAHGGMGPHGLVVGATGSGKSELLRTLVSGLTATHPPELLSLVLVDFKGGATFAGVTELPHVAGLITNLVDDLALVDRVRDALQGEQQRRQRILREAGNIDSVRAYQLRRAAGQTAPDGSPLEPLPYLLVIVDEFGELLSRRPDFIDLFVQIGRVGRSLGIHLLLATQRLEEGKLRGLDANLSYRICLRTFSAAESRTVIGTPDAYRLPPIPGSAYLKVSDSTYERLRVAHVSGPYLGPDDPADTPAAPPGPVPFTLRTAPDPDAEPERPAPRPPAPATGPTEMQVLVERLCRAGRPAHQVWLPPLPPALPLDALTGPVAADPGTGLRAQWWPGNGELAFPVGVIDVPARQEQHPLAPDFAIEHGHLAVIGAPQSGKSTFLRTLLLSAMLTHTPDQAQFTCLDFGGGGLLPYENAPHVSGVAGRHDLPRVRRALAETRALIEERETRFRELGIDSAAEFRRRRAAGELPAGLRAADVFLVLDNWGALRGELEEADALVLDIAGRGLGVGVHLILTANRWPELRMALRDSISGRLELRLGDPADSEIDRRAARRFVGAPPGRGQVPGGHQFHVALPRLDGLDTAEGLADAQQETIAKIAASWPGRPAPPIRMLPERIRARDLPPLPDAVRGVPIGLGEDDLAPVPLDLEADDPHFLVYGDSGAGKTEFLRMWMAALAARRPARDVRFVVVDYRRTLLGAVPDEYVGAYAGDAGAAKVYAEQVAAKLAERLPPPTITARRLRDRDWWSGPELYVVVDDYDLVAASRPAPLAVLADHLPQAREIGFHLVAARRVAGSTRTQLTDPLLGRVRELGTAGLVLSGDPREGPLLGPERATPRPPGRGVLVSRTVPRMVVQVALGEEVGE
ncbi:MULTISPECIES: type VII secretion protein EccC [Streptomycetaceae]|uniref:ATP/GTP binding protein membrane protein n=1 Tax=Streptantibioticus cattleyicolor (strain ATCC 35852 / DSM 46488 / JCM 4925 / NBRC 14057 / NRRL 8057) TaxID=1003195 RepID=F8JY84_STREN|nr:MULTISPECIES: type VII secretion protein EccC [Streptomycetaceae]AEW94669.1 ATP/GTP binding protein membrane protein [Streptantibioticus cattleyicolor NRRL 8057 = DSM 46488]MYS59304.1 type VII secretion protein EccC [Streptomyces sp. SID5468]CCB75025.1 putative ATP/GTP binding protein (membrane protein) [Streptantibioticus cattleyicolor NRRL 8057 = DSM 46488]